MLKLLRSNSVTLNNKLNIIKCNQTNLRCLSSASKEIVLTKRNDCLIKLQKRNCSMKEVDEFLKTTKIRFLSNNQVDTEEELTRKELFLLVFSVAFMALMAVGYLFTHTLEYSEKVDYKRFTYKPEEKATKLDTSKSIAEGAKQ